MKLCSGSYDHSVKVAHPPTPSSISASIRRSNPQTPQIWDWRTGHCWVTLYGHTASARCLHFNSTHLVTGSLDKSIKASFPPPPNSLITTTKYTNREKKIPCAKKIDLGFQQHGHRTLSMGMKRAWMETVFLYQKSDLEGGTISKTTTNKIPFTPPFLSIIIIITSTSWRRRASYLWMHLQ